MMKIICRLPARLYVSVRLRWSEKTDFTDPRELARSAPVSRFFAEAMERRDIDMIEISLTGVVPEVYRNFQGSGLPFERCEQNLRRVVNNVILLAKKRDETRKNTYIRLRYIRSRELGSWGHLKDYVKFWRDTGVDEIFVTALWDFKRSEKSGGDKFKIIRCHCMNSPFKVNANGDVFSCANNHDAVRYTMGNVCQTPLEEILRSDNFINDKAAKMTCDIKKVPKTCLSCECRRLRDFFEEVGNMRKRIFLRNPAKNGVYALFGIIVMIYERANRNDLFHKIFWGYMCKKSRKIHDDFSNLRLRSAGEKVQHTPPPPRVNRNTPRVAPARAALKREAA
jgi:radical SAM protein with 4Fe4S-binding SPASM domain